MAGDLVASFVVKGVYQASQFVLSGDQSGGVTGGILVTGGGPKVAHHTIDDFNGDGRSDVLWFAPKTGNYTDWSLDGAKPPVSHSIGAQKPGDDEVLAGVGDFNGDGTSDLLWRNSSTGAISVWDLSGGKYKAAHAVGAEAPSTHWAIAGVGDFNGDGTSDILWTDGSADKAMIWTIRDNKRISSRTFDAPGAGWTVIGTGDFNDDGVSDVLWQDGSTHKMLDWQMDNGMIEARDDLPAPAAGWTYVGNGALARGGADDLLFETGERELVAWKMVDGRHSGNLDLGIAAPKGFAVAAIGDFNGDGISDVGLYDKSNGEFEVGLVNASGHIDKWSLVGTVNPATTRFAA